MIRENLIKLLELHIKQKERAEKQIKEVRLKITAICEICKGTGKIYGQGNVHPCPACRRAITKRYKLEHLEKRYVL